MNAPEETPGRFSLPGAKAWPIRSRSGSVGPEWRREAPVKRVALAAVVAASVFSLCAAGCASQSKPSEVAGDGWAKVNCAVAPNGGLSDCRIVKEHPEGAGFGEAVLKAAASGRFSAPSGAMLGRGSSSRLAFASTDVDASVAPIRPDASEARRWSWRDIGRMIGARTAREVS